MFRLPLPTANPLLCDRIMAQTQGEPAAPDLGAWASMTLLHRVPKPAGLSSRRMPARGIVPIPSGTRRISVHRSSAVQPLALQVANAAKQKPMALTRMLRVVASAAMGKGWLRRAATLTAGVALGVRYIPLLRMQREPAQPSRPGGDGARTPGILWLRSDLRLHDHEALSAANSESSSLIPVYCFDPRDYGKGTSGFDRTGPSRARFILDSVADLRAALRSRGSDLVILRGRPEDELPRLAHLTGAGAIFCHKEVTQEEVQVEAHVRAALQRSGVTLRTFWGGSTLYHTDDLPFKPDTMPTCYSQFREAVEKLSVRPVLDAPRVIKGFPVGACLSMGDLPTMRQLGFSPADAVLPAKGPTSSLSAGLRGGETEALKHLRAFVAHVRQSSQQEQQQQAATAGKGTGKRKSSSSKQAQQAALGPQFSCRISPWLAMGCLSPRQMYHELRTQLGSAASSHVPASATPGTAMAGSGTSNGGSNWLVFELLWRDFFRLISTKYTSGPQTAASAGAQSSRVGTSFVGTPTVLVAA